MNINTRNKPQKTTRDAQDIWSRMASLWEGKPALEAVTEMAQLLKMEGWTDAKATHRRITIDFEPGEDDGADAIFDEIGALLDRPDAIGFLSIRSVPPLDMIEIERDRCANIAVKLGADAAARGIGNMRLETFAEQIAAEIKVLYDNLWDLYAKS